MPDVVDILDVKTKNKVFNFLKTVDQFILKRLVYRFASGHIVITSYLAKIYKGAIVVPPLCSAKELGERSPDHLSITYAGFPVIKQEP